MNNINFVELCRLLIDEHLTSIDKRLLEEAIQFIALKAERAENIRKRFAELIANEGTPERKKALFDKRLIELHKVRSEVQSFLIQHNIISREKREAQPDKWLDNYFKDVLSEYPGIVSLSTQYITSNPPQEPSVNLLPPPEQMLYANPLTARQIREIHQQRQQNQPQAN